MRFDKLVFLLMTCIISLNVYACNHAVTIQTSTRSPVPSTATKTLVPLSTKTIKSTAILPGSSTIEPTSTEWLPYNANPSDHGCGEFTAKLPIEETDGLSQEEIAQKLLEVFFRHFKSPELGGMCRLEDFRVEIVKEDKRLAFLAKEQQVDYVRTVEYSLKIKEVPSDWVAGNGEFASDGWIIHKFWIIGITKVDDQYVLKLIGTGP